MAMLLFTLLLAPSIALAHDGMTLRDHAALRRVERLKVISNFGKRTQTIRLGNNVRTRRMSARRMQKSTAGKVIAVVDGSVLEVRLYDGRTISVRTLGAEAPLLLTGTKKEQCFALEAKQKLKILLLGKRVELERDRKYQKDNYGRWLRYVRLKSLDVGGWMIGNGNAFADSRNGHRKQSNYTIREAEAKDYERGLWGHICEYNRDLDTIDVLE